MPLRAVAGEVAAGAVSVARDLGAELVEAGEFPFLAQAVEEPRPQGAAVEVTRVVEYVGLDDAIKRTANRRAHADIGHAPPPVAVDQARRHVHAVGGQDAVFDPEIGRWE